jgi:hypothetical protein
MGAAVSDEPTVLFDRLDALGDDVETELPGHRDRAVHDGSITRIAIEPTNEALVEFHRVERPVAKVTE